MQVTKIKEYLDEQNVKYVVVNHAPAYTAREVAASTLVPRREFAKVIVVKLDGKYAMLVLPANRHVDLDKVRKLAGASEIELATEQEFEQLFPDCEVGAMPPFGNLYDIDVYADEMLKEDEDITFNAGSHTQVMRLAFADYARLVAPKFGDFAVKE